MKEDQTCKRFPSIHNAHHMTVVDWASKVQPSCQIVSGADVIARKNVNASETSQEHVFRRPSSYAG
jgi:hypothetical protein